MRSCPKSVRPQLSHHQVTFLMKSVSVPLATMPFSFSSLIPWSTPSEGGPDYIPLADTPKPKSRRRHERLSFTALVLAALVGIFIIYLAFLFFHHRSEYDDSLRISNNESTFTSASEGDNLSLAQLRDIVARSKGYWARDYSLNLGWNNVSTSRPPRTWNKIQ